MAKTDSSVARDYYLRSFRCFGDYRITFTRNHVPAFNPLAPIAYITSSWHGCQIKTWIQRAYTRYAPDVSTVALNPAA